MKFSKLVIALIFVITSTTTSFAADAGAIGVITDVVKKHITKEVVESVYVEKTVGDFALAIVSVKDGEGGIAYLKKSGNSWAVLNYGDALTEAGLVTPGVPQDIAKKLSD